MDLEKNNKPVNYQEGAEKAKLEAIRFLKDGAVEIGSDVKVIDAPIGYQFGNECNEGEYNSNNNWVNFKQDGRMFAVYGSEEVYKKVEQAGFLKKSGLGVIDSNPDRFHSGTDSSAFKRMAAQVAEARQRERNNDERHSV